MAKRIPNSKTRIKAKARFTNYMHKPFQFNSATRFSSFGVYAHGLFAGPR